MPITVNFIAGPNDDAPCLARHEDAPIPYPGARITLETNYTPPVADTATLWTKVSGIVERVEYRYVRDLTTGPAYFAYVYFTPTSA